MCDQPVLECSLIYFYTKVCNDLIGRSHVNMNTVAACVLKNYLGDMEKITLHMSQRHLNRGRDVTIQF